MQLKRYLDMDHVMDALKSASTMLNELRTSSLTPKHYYELYMAVLDALRHLSIYLYDAHTGGKHHLADLYELVQYCGHIVPRLYLMITVGSVYMSVPDAPVREIMKDMTEMSRGVQHPTRGLFLRHYLPTTTRDHLPTGSEPGPAGDLVGDPGDDPPGARMRAVGHAAHAPAAVVITHHPVEGDDGTGRPILNGGCEPGHRHRRTGDLGPHDTCARPSARLNHGRSSRPRTAHGPRAGRYTTAHRRRTAPGRPRSPARTVHRRPGERA